MLGTEMRETRRQMNNMRRADFATLLGYTGTERNNVKRIQRYENNQQQIPLYIARLVWILGVWWRRAGELPPFPDWPGYEFEHTPDDKVKKCQPTTN